MKTITLICPARDNKKYLQWSYASVRKHCSPDVEYLVAVDSSIDGTEEWCEETSKKDKHFKFIVNHSSRMGHTNLYDQLISLATTEVVMVWHCDMIATPNMDKKILQKIKKGQVISLTRIEPPLHPPDNSKIQADIGTEPENFKEEYFLSLVKELEKKQKPAKVYLLRGLYSKRIFKQSMDTIAYLLHSRKRIQIFLIGLF